MRSRYPRLKPLSNEQEQRLEAVQARRRRLPKTRRSAIAGWASVEDVEEFVRLTSDRVQTVYIFELDGGRGYEWTMWNPDDPAEAVYPRHEGTLIKTVTLDPEPR